MNQRRFRGPGVGKKHTLYKTKRAKKTTKKTQIICLFKPSQRSAPVCLPPFPFHPQPTQAPSQGPNTPNDVVLTT